jgi:DNA-binding NtrC family response regulator
VQPPLSEPGPIPSLAVELVGPSAAAVRTRELVRRAAPLDGGVLLVAEPGIDTASIAREIHDRSRYAERPFCVLACSEGATSDLERRLFGTRSDADRDRVAIAADSLLAEARGGTLYLQDALDLSAALQARLARVVRDGEIMTAGAVMPLGLRLVASAPPTVDEDVRANRFRSDLFRRLAVSRIDLPPLRERVDDIAALAERVLHDACRASGVPPRSFTQAAQALLAALAWPGNLGELRATIAGVVAGTDAAVLQIEHLLPVLRLERAAPAMTSAATLRDARQRFERDYIAQVLQRHGWRLAEAARALGIQRPNLYRKARQLGIPLTRQSA